MANPILDWKKFLESDAPTIVHMDNRKKTTTPKPVQSKPDPFIKKPEELDTVSVEQDKAELEIKQKIAALKNRETIFKREMQKGLDLINSEMQGLLIEEKKIMEKKKKKEEKTTEQLKKEKQELEKKLKQMEKDEKKEDERTFQVVDLKDKSTIPKQLINAVTISAKEPKSAFQKLLKNSSEELKVALLEPSEGSFLVFVYVGKYLTVESKSTTTSHAILNKHKYEVKNLVNRKRFKQDGLMEFFKQL